MRLSADLCRLSLLAASLALTAAGCGSSSQPNGAGASQLADVSADQVATGTWAKQTILTANSSAAGINDKSKIERLMLVTMARSGDDLVATEQVCDLTSYASGSTLTFPAAFKSSVPTRDVTYKATGAGLASTSALEVLGVNLANPATDTLPSSRDDARVVDQDRDGKPGVTVSVSARAIFVTISGNLYLLQRQTTTETGTAVDASTLRGNVAWTIEQKILGADNAILGAVTPVITPLASESTFSMKKIADGSTCATVLARRAELFRAPTL